MPGGRVPQVLGGGIRPHLGDEGEGGLLTVLEPPQQQQQVFLLVDQRLAEALCSQVTSVQTLDLSGDKNKSTIRIIQNILFFIICFRILITTPLMQK